jgi:hypothetical protein
MPAAPDDVLRYTAFRIALATGILGAVGATLGWIGWLTGKVLSWPLVLTVLVGAGLGVVVHWIRHYVQVARKESQGVAPHSAAGAGDHRPRSVVALFWAGGFGFLGLVSEHLVAHMAAEFLRPLLASLASLLPAGVIIGWRMNRGRPSDENFFQLIAEGLITGAMITLVTGFIWHFGFGEVPWFALVSWWGMIGIGVRIMTGTDRNAVRLAEPVIAVVMVFAATFLLNLLPTTRATYERFGALGNVPLILRTMSAEIQQSPALPATFWLDAERRYQEEHVEKKATISMADALGPARRDTTRSSLQGLGLSRAVSALTDTSIEHAAVQETPGARTEYLRSWLVVLLFALGVGAAPGVERALRPVDYPSSETYRRDITLAIVVVLVLVATMFARPISSFAHRLFPGAASPE